MRIMMVNLTGGGLSGGYRKYLRAVVPRLRAEARVCGLDVFAPPTVAEELRAAGLGPIETWPGGDARRGFASLTAALRSLRPDVVFIPTARALPGLGTPQVVMVRNMEPLERPLAGLGPRAALVNLARAFEARRACRRAERVIAVSRHVADVVTGRWGLRPDRVRIVYHGVSAPDAAAAVRPSSLGDLNPGPFLFTAGSLRPARGLGDAIAALQRLGSSAPLLVVAGAADADTVAWARRLESRVERLALARKVRFLGWLDEPALSWCHEHAAAFLMTSRAEACPNTALEAMSHGGLVLSTDHPPMPEILGDGALYYRERDATDLARRIAWLEGATTAERDALRAAVRERARLFDWDTSIRATVDVLAEAAGQGLRP